ncbi:MAG: pyruvate, water dikinase regulatory protein [Desulfatiglans sp.]|jgi:regulator of PEP synthase PpsR (kinase-PPPase family)|nr:pyruvate, water dikinase regulatory protein [Thermodesulfobacteriota bacterium]MEE4352664.1 pyruvate, water dikinase regulatory protein [Desulfatiglans sp.]
MEHIFIISDGTGRTAQQALDAALTQFAETITEVHVFPEIRTESQVVHAVEHAAKAKGFIVHTVVSRDLRRIVRRIGRLHNVETIDLMGPLLAMLSHQFSYSPSETPGLFYEMNQAYFRRVEAMDFALHHDDGKRVEQLPKAEIVLVGVSRTFKTPLSIYLAFKGWFVANIPVVLGLDLPVALFQLPPGRVFALTTEAAPLARLRKARLEEWHGLSSEYCSLDSVYQELRNAENIFETNPGWTVINVTNKPIEEIATQILSVIREREAGQVNKKKKRSGSVM